MVTRDIYICRRPFSHQFEHVLHDYGKELKQRQGSSAQDLENADRLINWSHEEQSAKMLDYLLKANKIDLGLDANDLIFIKELINGYPLGWKPPKDEGEPFKPKWNWNPPPPYQGRGVDKIFLYEIVSNKRTGLDVDRLDYLQRDVQAALGQHSKTFEKLTESVAVCTDDNGLHVLAYPEDEVQGVMETYTTRMSMYNKVYMHRKTLIMDEMVKDILLAAKDAIRIPVRDVETGRIIRTQGLIELICQNDMAAFSQLDDSILDMIRLSEVDTEGMVKASLLMQQLR